MAQASDEPAQASVAATGEDPAEPACPFDPAGPGRWPLPLAARAAAALLALIPLGLLGVAGALEPDADGLGTHRQLGLPPCSMRLMFGVRCPSCGMTTSWAHFVRGQWRASWAANPGGLLLALYSLSFAAASGAAAWRGRLPAAPLQSGLAVALVAIAAVAVAQWLLRLY